MRLLIVALVLLTAGGAAAQAPAAAPSKACRLEQRAELKVAFGVDNAPVVDATVNGLPARVVFDTGATVSLLMRSAAKRFGAPGVFLDGAQAAGVGGFSSLAKTHLKQVVLSGVAFDNLPVYVAGERALGVDMLMGRDFMARTDIELDLAHGVIRLLNPVSCRSDQMVYWAPTYSQAPLQASQQGGPFEVDVQLNGRPVRAEIDSGAARSVASLQVAERAAVRLNRVEAGAEGIGGRVLPESVGELDSFTIGDETIRKTRLRFLDMAGALQTRSLGSHIPRARDGVVPQMLLGADFLRSHRVLISRSQRMVYFTYGGGPVFDVTRAAVKPPVAPPPAVSPQAASSRAPAGS